MGTYAGVETNTSIMITNNQFFYISPETYLEGERVSPIKHEYRKGQVYAMVGAKKSHIVLASNLTMILGNHLENGVKLGWLIEPSEKKVEVYRLDFGQKKFVSVKYTLN